MALRCKAQTCLKTRNTFAPRIDCPAMLLYLRRIYSAGIAVNRCFCSRDPEIPYTNRSC